MFYVGKNVWTTAQKMQNCESLFIKTFSTKTLLKANVLPSANTMLPNTEKKGKLLLYRIILQRASYFTLNLQTSFAYITPNQPKHNKLNICFLTGEGLFILWFYLNTRHCVNFSLLWGGPEMKRHISAILEPVTSKKLGTD